MLNGQVSDWSDVKTSVPQGSILGPLFLIYINNLSKGLSSNAKLFADDTSLFSVIHDSHTSALELNSDLAKVNRWAFQWKISFNPDPKKQAQEVILSRKSKAISHPPLVFNSNNVIQTTFQKHLGIILDTRLSFEKRLETVLSKINKTIGLIRKLQDVLPRTALITLHKASVRPHLDYGDIIYYQAHNASFHQKLEPLQYNACLTIAGALRGSLREKIYQELGFESLQQRYLYREQCSFCKVFKNESPRYLFNITPIRNPACSTRNHVNFRCLKPIIISLKTPLFHLPLSNGIISTLIC